MEPTPNLNDLADQIGFRTLPDIERDLTALPGDAYGLADEVARQSDLDDLAVVRTVRTHLVTLDRLRTALDLLDAQLPEVRSVGRRLSDARRDLGFYTRPDGVAKVLALAAPRMTGSTSGSWGFQDFEDVLSGEFAYPEPALLRLADNGPALLYKGQDHVIAGDSSRGKSWVAVEACRQVLMSGGVAAYFDFETDRGQVVGRLLNMGVQPQQIRRGFRYSKVDDGLAAPGAKERFIAALRTEPMDLVVIDGTTDSFARLGLDQNSGVDTALWQQQLPKRIITETAAADPAGVGAAVLSIDHLTKSRDKATRTAQGSQHKLSGTNVQYIVDYPDDAPLVAPGIAVSFELRVAKDRPGGVLRHARFGVAAVVTIDSTPDRPGEPATVVRLDAAAAMRAEEKTSDGLRTARDSAMDTAVMEHMQAVGTVPSKSALAEAIGKRDHLVGQAVKRLTDTGHLVQVGRYGLGLAPEPGAPSDDDMAAFAASIADIDTRPGGAK